MSSLNLYLHGKGSLFSNFYNIFFIYVSVLWSRGSTRWYASILQQLLTAPSLSLSLSIFLSLVESSLFVKASVNEVSKVTSKQPAVTKPVWNEDILL